MSVHFWLGFGSGAAVALTLALQPLTQQWRKATAMNRRAIQSYRDARSEWDEATAANQQAQVGIAEAGRLLAEAERINAGARRN